MCGITGIIRYNAETSNTEIKQMTDAIAPSIWKRG